jgi:DNA-binding MarR family transcriptional regulator
MSAPRTFYLIRQVSSVIRTVIERGLAELGITPAQYTLMNWLAQREGVTSAMLARALQVSPQSMSTMISALHDKGLVARRNDSTNKRILLISLTTAGKAALEACDRVVDGLEDEYFGQLRATELIAFRETLEGLLFRRGRRGPNANR